MTVKIEFDGELPFPVEFAEFMVASSAPKDAVKYTPQSPTSEQQAQARANIGAMAAGIQKAIAINSTNDTAADVVLKTELRESGTAAMQFYSGGADAGVKHPTILGGLAAGEKYNDAATVEQARQAAPVLLVVGSTEDGKDVLVDGDWDSMLFDLKEGRSIILTTQNILSSDLDVSIEIFYLAIVYQEDGYAVFFSVEENTNRIAIVRYDGSVEFKYENLLKLDPTLSRFGNFAAPAAVVGEKLGNIETTLAAVKPYVVKLVYAYDEGSGEMVPSMADSFGFNWDDMVAAVKSNRPVICYLSGVEGSDDVVDASAFELTYIEYANEFAIFSSTTEVGVEHITLVKDSTVVKHQQWNYVRESDFNDTVGNIETALDSIIAIQENLIGGGA